MLTPKELFSDNKHFNVLYALLLLAMATLPFTNWLMLPIAVAMVVNWIWEWNWREKRDNLRARHTLPAVIIFSSLYLLTIVGFLISSRKSTALAAFDCDIWFLVAPIVILSYKPELFTPARMRLLFGVFAASCVLQCLIIVPFGLYRVVYSGNSKYLYYIYLSLFKHPSYVAMYMTFAFFWLLRDMHLHWHTSATRYKALSVPALALLALTVVLLQSKAGLICISLLSTLWILLYFAVRRHHPFISLLILGAVVGISIFVYQSGIIRNNRALIALEQFKNHKDEPYGEGSGEIRLTIWKSSWEVAVNNLPWGTGTGDATEDLKLNALQKNYTNLIEHNYNAHCQYLQELVETGILGLAILLAYCLYPLFEGVRRKDILLFSFAILVMLNITVECMFETRSGVGFIALTNVLLWTITARCGSRRSS